MHAAVGEQAAQALHGVGGDHGQGRRGRHRLEQWPDLWVGQQIGQRAGVLDLEQRAAAPVLCPAPDQGRDLWRQGTPGEPVEGGHDLIGGEAALGGPAQAGGCQVAVVAGERPQQPQIVDAGQRLAGGDAAVGPDIEHRTGLLVAPLVQRREPLARDELLGQPPEIGAGYEGDRGVARRPSSGASSRSA